MQQEELGIIRSHAGLRGVAASVVMVFHFLYYGMISRHDSPQQEEHLIRIAWIAVDLFFMLSGFILCWVYFDPRRQIDWKKYLVARVARICPLYYLTFSVAMAIMMYSFINHGDKYIGKHNFPVAVAANFSMLSGVLDIPTFNGPAWSISVEFFCYLTIFPLLTHFARGVLIGKNLEYRFVLGFLMVVFTCLMGLHVCILNQYAQFHGWNPVWLLRGILGFIVGFLICFLFKSFQTESSYLPAIKLISIISTTMVFLGIFKIIPVNLVIYCIPAMIYSLAYDVGPISCILSTKPIQTLGVLSYGIYMWHMLLLLICSKRVDLTVRGILPESRYRESVECIVFVFAVLLVASVSYRWIEVPARRWIRSIVS